MKKYRILQKMGLFDKAKLVVEGKIVGKPGDRVLKVKNIVSGETLRFVTKKKYFDLKLFKLPYDSESIDWVPVEQEIIDKMNKSIPEIKEFLLNDLEFIEEVE